MPGAGDLDQQILLEVPVVEPDELGQNVESWFFFAQPWAKVIETPGQEFLKGDYRPEERVVFKIYWREMDSTYRVTWGGRTWRINSVTGTRREGYSWLHCVSTDGVN